MRTIVQEKQFKKDFKKISTSGHYQPDDLFNVLELLAKDVPLTEKYHDHSLQGS